MYIEYITPQRIADPNYTKYDSKGGDYRPTWLIRTSDWQKVPGLEATDGYHTLSYCWEQSGEKVQQADGEYGLTDDGHHRITTKFLEKRKTRRSTRYRRPTRTKYVSYDDLIQQVCKDFDIEYLWYDKICIDQTNKAEKHREIKQMHLIYSNARFTVALVPEINIEDRKDFERMSWVYNSTEAKRKALRQMEKSLWWKRSWTLEEVMMSTQILIVGRNTHFWSLADSKKGERPAEDDLLSGFMLGITEREMKSANLVLRFAHFRTSTKQHDKVFALANIFVGIVDIEIDYTIDVVSTMSTFYRRLAEKDLSVLCFGSILGLNGKPWFATTMDCYVLPSWTGISGVHLLRPIADITLDKNCDYTIDDNMRLHIKCRSYAIRLTKYNDNDIYSDNERREKAHKYFYYKVITSMDDFEGNESEALDWSQWYLWIAIGTFATHYHKPDDRVPFLSPILPLSLTEECDECVILGIVFDSVLETVTADSAVAGYAHQYLSPVAKKSADGSFKIIGVILLKHFHYYETRPTPQEYMDQMFDSLGCEAQEFCIE